jgi:hypothetical protein
MIFLLKNKRKLSKNASKSSENAKVELKIITEMDDDDDDDDEDDDDDVDDCNNLKTTLSLHPEQSKSLLSVPSICNENVDSESTTSTNFDRGSSNFDQSECIDTVSMILRNVEAMDRDTENKTSEEIAINATNADTRNSKKHDFIHDLKGTIQEKFHHMMHHHHHHHDESLPTKNESGKPKEKILHELKENVSGKFHQIADKLHHIHFPHMHHSHAEDDESLMSQALQTMLLEKFNIAEASTSHHQPSPSSSDLSTQKRKSSSSSLESIKQKFHLFQRPRRSVELPSETNSLKPISEINAPRSIATTKASVEIDIVKRHDDYDEHSEKTALDEENSVGSFESAVTVIYAGASKRKAISKEDLRLSVQNFDSIMSHSFENLAAADDTNKRPLHESLLSLSRNELLSASPNIKTHTHARTESIGCKFSAASPSKQAACQTQSGSGGGSLPTASTAIFRRSSDSDLSLNTPKGDYPLTITAISFPFQSLYLSPFLLIKLKLIKYYQTEKIHIFFQLII